mgnify:CR=1 FL=1
MKALVIILGILSAVIILGLLMFSFIFEIDCQQPKKLDENEEVKNRDDLPENREDEE